MAKITPFKGLRPKPDLADQVATLPYDVVNDAEARAFRHLPYNFYHVTRAEIDRGLASSLGETVGLEALGSITGADKAVKSVVPLIDEFRFGSGYSSRTGRTEPTVTVGVSISRRIRPKPLPPVQTLPPAVKPA